MLLEAREGPQMGLDVRVLDGRELDSVSGGFHPLGVLVGAVVGVALVAGAACTGLIIGDYIANGDNSVVVKAYKNAVQ